MGTGAEQCQYKNTFVNIVHEKQVGADMTLMKPGISSRQHMVMTLRRQFDAIGQKPDDIVERLNVLASLHPRIRGIKRTFEAGTFFILIFSIAVASQVSLKTLSEVEPGIFMFTTVATLGALLFHVLLSAIFRIDTDTTLTTSISLICSPPFAPVMGSALHNKAVIGPGIAVGLFGYAVGTYLGFGIAKMLLLMA